MTTIGLPVIDLSLEAEPVATAIDDACRSVGFFVLEGHGIDAAVREAVFAAAHALFALPLAEKRALAIGNSPCHRGYVGEAAETLDAGRGGDAKEAFDLSADLGPDHPEVAAGTPLYGPNQWPATTGFREAVEAYYDAALGAARALAVPMAMAIGAPPTFFTDRMADSVTNLRLLHYPPADAGSDRPGAGEHSDYGMVTLLATDGVGGLEVRRRDGAWQAVDVDADQFVVNIGDLTARWSNGRWVSTPHRVTSPAGVDRYSIPLFVNPNFHTVVEPVVGPGETPAFEPVVCGEYLLSRFDDTHAYRSTPAGTSPAGNPS